MVKGDIILEASTTFVVEGIPYQYAQYTILRKSKKKGLCVDSRIRVTPLPTHEVLQAILEQAQNLTVEMEEKTKQAILQM